MFVGVGASRVRDLFKQARDKAPCIIFIDEIDILVGLEQNFMTGGNDERKHVKSIISLDGFLVKK